MTDSDLQNDFAIVKVQEDTLVFDTFNEEVAFELGCRLRARAAAESLPVVIDIRFHDRPLFYASMPGTSANNAEWVAAKSNVVLHFLKSSYAIGLSLMMAGTTLEEKYGLPFKDYRAHGGSFPITVKGCGVIGAITVSGLPQREDHKFVVNCLAEFLGLPAARLAMD